ncbi:dTDP-4-dehydrorhamnose 3,5-epimerase [Marinihelvus fidelis]|uniref:dTDP-4-dehydrorhamnose 3,5-epimerase n=1 Tax=Marinihelvus fidelis TaxID=2613842 RepID=A0A5N0TGA7_9GAMM|nr:dTDP-4-dehydrorhamnose 3,5-epimerase family protein [Marinihelvus fidelis]KAA9134080.1 dTDP-4-dehydrorhamnose 3,5-epimerase [Marinihelvus fidelis]
MTVTDNEVSKDSQLVDRAWNVLQDLIDGVVVREVRHVPRDHGVITEMYREEWDDTGLPVHQVYQSRLYPGAIGAWSCHQVSIDRLFVNQGHIKVVLYDGRPESGTFGRINEFHVGDMRPALVKIPTGVWHGLQNLGTTDALVVNLPTLPYQYEDPDHYRRPFDTAEIPYDWNVSGVSRVRSVKEG